MRRWSTVGTNDAGPAEGLASSVVGDGGGPTSPNGDMALHTSQSTGRLSMEALAVKALMVFSLMSRVS